MMIRLAQPADALAVARVHVRAWKAAYRGLLPQDYLDGLKPEDRAARYSFAHTDPLLPRTLVAIDGDILCGFVTTMPAHEPDMPAAGELAALYVDVDHWASGIGATLLDAACEYLVAARYEKACLWVLPGNVRAARFYTRHGWSADGMRKKDAMWGVTVDIVRYVRTLNSVVAQRG
jgi:ribosomal protein S18 acetylase RimI-like enzyme